MMSFILALVIATFMRRRSFRNPICPSSLERTREMRITSLSLPLETIYRIYADEAAVRLEELILFDEFLEILHLGTVRRNDAYIDSFLQNALFAYLGEVFRQVAGLARLPPC